MRAAQSRPYWKLIQLTRRIRFEVRKRILWGSENYFETVTANRILIELARITLPSLLLALGTATALLISELLLPMTAKWRWVPFPLWRLEDRDSYATFLSTISGIGGVLIGLYYAGLTAVSSAAYAEAPGVLRNLLLRQPVGRFYIKLLAYATFVSLCLLAFYAIGFSPIRLAIPFLVLLSGLTILSFVQLGQQAFYFFDPTRLADSVFADLDRWVKKATVRGRFWEDPTFQNHANQQAEGTLRALSTLAEYSSLQRYLKTDAIASLAISTVGFLGRYETARQLIPSESKWYPSDYRHPDFYLAGDLKVQMAVQTGGSVQPITVAQADWVEALAFPIMLKALQTNLEENNETSLFRDLNVLPVYVEHLAGLWEIEAVITTVEQVAQAIAPVAFSTESAASNAPRWRLGLVEYLSILPITALLGFVKSLEKAKRIGELLGNVRWEKPETLYRAGFPRFALPTLEWFKPRMEFEIIAEGKTITPKWFIEQRVAMDYLTELHKSVDLLVRANERFYGAWHKSSVEAKHPWAAACVLNRQGEYLLRLQANFDKIATSETEYESDKVTKDLLDWPSLQADILRNRITAIEQEHQIAIAKEAHSLITVKRPSYIPDFAGEFLSRTAQTVLERICQTETTIFSAVFPYFFEASIKKTGVLLRSDVDSTSTDPTQRFNLATGPLLDLMELSGYTILVSELRESPEPWNTAKALWDRYLSDERSAPTRMRIISRVLQVADIPMMFSPGELLRTNWRMRIQQLFRDIPVRRVVSGSIGIHIDNRVEHPSALVRVLARQSFAGFYRGIDVFAAMYFSKLTGSDVTALRLRSNDLVDAVQRESGVRGRREGGIDEGTGP